MAPKCSSKKATGGGVIAEAHGVTIDTVLLPVPGSYHKGLTMVDVERIGDLLSKLDGIDALREHLESLVREEIAEHFVDPLESLLSELEAKDEGLTEGDRLLLARVKKRLAGALPTEHVMDMVSTVAEDVRRSRPESRRGPLRRWWPAGSPPS
jgi:hypothetical protein